MINAVVIKEAVLVRRSPLQETPAGEGFNFSMDSFPTSRDRLLRSEWRMDFRS